MPTHKSGNDAFYDNHVSELNAQYLSVKAEDVHEAWLPSLQSNNSAESNLHALDVGTGVGRDAAYLSSLGYKVVAVDKSQAMLEQAKQNFPNQSITWLQDALPSLREVRKLDLKFDVILLSAIWMHIPASERRKCIRILSSLLVPNGKIVITLRHGSFSDGRTAHGVSLDELRLLSQAYGLIFRSPSRAFTQTQKWQSDKLNRQNVTWETAILTLPDDGSGAFPLLRNIVINDAKAATYKVALLRSVLRIAEGHPGAVIQSKSTSSMVAIPLGLVAMYWLKLFKPLIDNFNMPQNSNPNKGLGFVKESGWLQLSGLTNNDVFVGAIYMETHKQVHRTLLDITRTIKNMPAKYITLPGTDTCVFEVDRLRSRAPKTSLLLDNNYLMGLGTLYVPRNIWRTLSDYSCWIEPALTNEWLRVMQGFEAKTGRSYSLEQYHLALKWEDQTRSTNKVKQRVSILQKQQDIVCTWGKTKLNKRYDIDHTFPFARWPNNDLWNLVPTKPAVNRNKSDKLITEQRLLNSKEEVMHFWQQAWQEEQRLFFTQANMALPDLSTENTDFDSVFEAMLSQRDRIKETQQLVDWT
ncbi:methyltransferase domain-containing protein [Brumicola blandensis]|uniref:Methyltransferase domain-containing protein n=1 Tax=Brumicola blandensis TaxID=3075611 RepID=A0AAW8R1M6_9ALTE|nr:methyltransferase domain-containing protein [Alteromonas sp. W409]MDT0581995.1 methyltransferase domain-containing protein [Alteromonas sp. W409]